jgi:hypothetical protein
MATKYVEKMLSQSILATFLYNYIYTRRPPAMAGGPYNF